MRAENNTILLGSKEKITEGAGSKEDFCERRKYRVYTGIVFVKKVRDVL